MVPFFTFELLVIIASNECNAEEFCEWLDEGLLDTSEIEIFMYRNFSDNINDMMGHDPCEEDLDQVWSCQAGDNYFKLL